jgi:hypothetical protein
VLRWWSEALKAAMVPASGGSVALCPYRRWKKANGDGPLLGQNGRMGLRLATKIKGKRGWAYRDFGPK